MIKNQSEKQKVPGTFLIPSKGTWYLLLLLLFSFPFSVYSESEIFPETQTKVVVREHPHTGKPFVSVTSKNSNFDPFAKQKKLMKRPDYRMLDPKMKSGQIPYEGPYNDRKKVYILAASLATIGAVGGTAIIAAAPAATGTGAAGGAGLYAGAGVGVAAGTLGGSLLASKSGPEDNNFTHVSESHAVTTQTEKK